MVKNLLNSLKPNIILAIDASTNSFAYSIFNGTELIKYDKVNFVGNNVFEKTADSARKFKKEFTGVHIDAIVIEHTIFMNSPKTMADLSMVQGGILSAAILNGITKIHTVNPIAWQSFIGNKILTKLEKLDIMNANPGKSASWYKSYERSFRKQRTINIMNLSYGCNVSDNDISDAIGIGHYAIHNWNKLEG